MFDPGLRACPSAILTHQIAFHLDAMGVMYKPVKNPISERRIADLLVPA
jgi:hypothetical protein